MKKWMLLVLACAVVGCSYQGKTFGEYLNDPQSLIKDPHFTAYKDKREQLESDYLNKKITYADYVAAVKELDNNYAREVQQRNEKIAE
jgi:hypothetical protein